MIGNIARQGLNDMSQAGPEMEQEATSLVCLSFDDTLQGMFEVFRLMSLEWLSHCDSYINVSSQTLHSQNQAIKESGPTLIPLARCTDTSKLREL